MGTSTYTPALSRTVKVKAAGSAIKVWVAGTLEIDTTDSDIAWGAVAVGGWQAEFLNLKAGYDNNADDDIDDSGDGVVIDEDFGGTSVSPVYDDNGNLTKDGDYKHVYDAWNNLVKVTAQQDADTEIVVAEYGFFADNRRAKKVVSNRGELDGATYFFYDGQRVIEERDSSEDLIQQFVHGTQYIDELLMVRGAYGAYWVYQDANWNVIALTSPGSALVEEYDYTPYGRLLIRRHTAFGDADADGDLDSADNIAWNSTQGELGVYDRAFDADLDGDNDSFDETAFDRNYDAAGTSVIIPGRAVRGGLQRQAAKTQTLPG